MEKFPVAVVGQQFFTLKTQLILSNKNNFEQLPAICQNVCLETVKSR